MQLTGRPAMKASRSLADFAPQRYCWLSSPRQSWVSSRTCAADQLGIFCFDAILRAKENRQGSFQVHWQDRFIASCASWSDFWERTKKLSTTGEKGAVFERLTQLYLQTTPEYQSELEHVWTLREVPPSVRKLLALPLLDEGIDFI